MSVTKPDHDDLVPYIDLAKNKVVTGPVTSGYAQPPRTVINAVEAAALFRMDPQQHALEELQHRMIASARAEAVKEVHASLSMLVGCAPEDLVIALRTLVRSKDVQEEIWAERARRRIL